MSAFFLKIIACISMFIDHVGYVIFNGQLSWCNCIGRLAFPIFAFQISEGYTHTRNVKKYLLRLLLFAFVSQIPFMLFHSIINDSFGLNVIFTLLFGLVSIIVYDKYNKVLGIVVAIFLASIAQLLNCDYGLYGVAITFLFYVFGKNKITLSVSFIISTMLYYAYHIFKSLDYGISAVKTSFNFYLPYILCTMASLIFIILYNKKKGYNTKYLLYLFYPLHMLLLYALTL